MLPHVTAALNAVTIVFLMLGFTFIRRGNRDAHRFAMICAVVSSALFLAVYIVYHFTQPIFVFQGTGWVRPLYYVLMISHIVLALAVTPMILLTFARGLRGNFDRHRPLARWTVPLWFYVSVSGIVVYTMLYHVTWA